MSDFVRFVFSIGGMSCALLAGCLWAFLRRSSPAPRRFILAVVLTYSTASMYPLTHAAARLLSRSYHPLTASDVPAGRNAIVILGSGSFTAHDWDENRVSINDPAGADRVIEAVRVFRLIQPVVIVSSGGSVQNMDRLGPGGLVMKELLIQLGVPASRIIVETESQNTHDEAVIVKKMLDPLKIDHVVLVTSDFHMLRSVGTFRAVGVDVVPAIARAPHVGAAWDVFVLPTPTGLNEAHDVAHELVGIGSYAFRGWYK